MKPRWRQLRWALAAGLLAGAALSAANRLTSAPRPPVEFNVDDCNLVGERQGIDIRSIRVPTDVDKAAALQLLNAYLPKSREERGEWQLRGAISDAAADALAARLAAGAAPDALRVNSYGGSERAAIRIAELIARHRISVIVDGVCGSACANYLLPAAPSVTVDGIVLMHGSPAACLRQLGTFGAFEKLGWTGARLLRGAAQRQDDFEERHPRFEVLVERSVPRHRGDPSGAMHVWRFVPAHELTAAHAGLVMGPRHAEVAAAFRALLQTNPALSDAYFPE